MKRFRKKFKKFDFSQKNDQFTQFWVQYDFP